jgi:hypothetical protein
MAAGGQRGRSSSNGKQAAAVMGVRRDFVKKILARLVDCTNTLTS